MMKGNDFTSTWAAFNRRKTIEWEPCHCSCMWWSNTYYGEFCIFNGNLNWYSPFSGLVVVVNNNSLEIIAPGKDQYRIIELHRRHLCRGVLPIHEQVWVHGAAVLATWARILVGLDHHVVLGVRVVAVQHLLRRVSQLCRKTLLLDLSAVRLVYTAVIPFTVRQVTIPVSITD